MDKIPKTTAITNAMCEAFANRSSAFFDIADVMKESNIATNAIKNETIANVVIILII